MASKDGDFDPSRFSTPRLFQHTTLKGTQLGALFGCGIVLPLLALRGYRSGKPLDIPIASQALTYSTAGGLTVSSTLAPVGRLVELKGHVSDGMALALRMRMDKEGLEDRVYRLHYNTSQNRCDLFSATCGFLSAAAAPFLINQSATTIIGAFTVGTAVGTIVHILSAPEKATGVEKMVHELTK